MSKYLKKFETQAAYEAAESGLILPNVSLTVDNNTVHYNPSTPVPPTPSHDYVDLGLPSGTLWATMNIGASSITDYGNYYQYGKGAAQYAATSGDTDYEGMESPLLASADTAVQVWGGQWHMPTRTQLQELTANTTYQWVTGYQGSNVNGATFTANGQTLFIPAAGYWDNGNQKAVGTHGRYWSSTPASSVATTKNAYNLHISESSKDANYMSRKYGYTIRPVIG